MPSHRHHPRPLRLRDALPIWWQVARPWFVGTSKAQAWRYVSVCACLAVAHTLVAVKVSYAQKHFSTALAEKNRAAWMAAVWEFVVIICLFAPIRSLEAYAEKRMVAVWRTGLTQAFVTAYTSNKAYFHMQLARGTEGQEHEHAAEPGGPPGSGGALQAIVRQLSGDAAAQQGSKSSQHSLRVQVLRGSIDEGGKPSPPAGARTSSSRDATGSRSSSHEAVLGRTQDGVSAAAAPQHDHQQQQQQQQHGASAKGGGSGLVAGLSGASADVDNPDQRITADVANYVQTSVGVVLLLVRKTLNCAAFAGVLWSISPKLVVFLISYAVLGTAGTTAVFGAPLTRLKQRLLRLEADLRFGLVRLRENAEAIAFYGGDVREAADLSARLTSVLDVLLRRIAWLGGYELWLVVYRYATVLIPSLIMAPQYFAGQIEFGTMTQASFAFNVLEEALRLVLERMEDLSSLAAETGRLAGLLAALRAADVDAGGNGSVIGFGTPPAKHRATSSSSSRWWQWWRRHSSSSSSSSRGPDDVELARTATPGAGLDGSGGAAAGGGSHDDADGEAAALLGGAVANSSHAANGSSSSSSGLSRVLRLMDGSVSGLSVEGLTACVPGRHHQPMVVCADLSFSLAPGESLLVMGPSGCGKSSFLRIAAGLWTVGSGCVRGPGSIFFLPQKPYMPLGSLRQQVLFPTNCPASSRALAAHLRTAAQQQQQQDDEQQQHEPARLLPDGLKHRASHTAAAAGSGGASAADDSSAFLLHIAGGGAHQDAAASSSSSSDIDGQLQALLRAVNLGHLLTRFPAGLDAEVDWASVLSVGEQQRVALTRLLFHKPSLAFLDEATAALDPASEKVVYTLIARACSCIVSVGHRLQLLDFHTHVLAHAGGGAWAKWTVAEYRERLAAGQEG